jgi:lipopolysaccharide biosynthesis glycosyltransferase
MGKLAIYTQFDDNYFEYGATMLYSFFKYNTWFNGDFFIINDDECIFLSNENKEKLKKISDHIKILDVKGSEYAKVINNQYEICSVNKKWLSCFYELELFRSSYDKILWLDSDTIVRGSIEELFNDRALDGKFCCCQDIIALGYFNAGVYLLDQEVIKKYPFEKMHDFCANVTKKGLIKSSNARGDGRLVIQDCLNHLIAEDDRIYLPHSFYNVSVFFPINASSIGKIFHYNGRNNKPNGPTERTGLYDWFFKPYHELHEEAMKIVNGNGKSNS